jgi:acyl carrier protein
MGHQDRNPAAVREVIVRHLVKRDVPVEQITDDASFTQDLAIDSLDLHALAMELEDEFGVAFSARDAPVVATVGDAVDFVMQAGSLA